MQHIAQESGRFVVEIMAGSHHIVLLFDRHAIELVPLDCATCRAGRAMDEHGQFLDPRASLLFDCVEVQFGSMGGSDRFGEFRHFRM